MVEFEKLISSFYDLPINEKEKVIHDELARIKSILDTVMQFKNNNISNDMTEYNSSDDSDNALVGIYHDLMLIEESLVIYLKDAGY